MLSCLNLGELRIKYTKFNHLGYKKYIQAFSGLWTPDQWIFPFYKKSVYVLPQRMTPGGQEYFQSYLIFFSLVGQEQPWYGREVFIWNWSGTWTHLQKITFYVKHRFPAGPQKDWPEIKFKFYIFVKILCSILSGNSHIMDKSF